MHGSRSLQAVAAGVSIVVLSATVGIGAPPAGIPLATRVYAEDKLQVALESARSGINLDWFHADTESQGRITVLQTYFVAGQIPCRDYERAVEFAERDPYVWRGTGCRIGDRWHYDEAIVSAPVETPPPEPQVEKEEVPGAANETVANDPPPPPPVPQPVKPEDSVIYTLPYESSL